MNGRLSAGGPNIVGISANFHDSACCVLVDGRLVAAAQEERFSRIKHDASIPRQAFRYCLQASGLTVADIDCVAYYENPTRKLARQLWSGQTNSAPGDPFRFSATRPAHQIREVLGFAGLTLFFDHHKSHAASSFFYSGFDEAAILTFDGVGEWATTVYGHGRRETIEIFEEVGFPSSLGLLYSAVTSYLGFGVNDGEYKVMGLAPFGRPTFVNQIGKLVINQPAGQYQLELRYFDFTNPRRMYTDALIALLGEPARQPESQITQFHKDVAHSLQVTLEKMVLAKAGYLRDRVGTENLCIAGGVAMNSVANGKLLRSRLFRHIYIPPACGDAGGAMGAAALAYAQLVGKCVPQEPLANACLGPDYSSGEIAMLLRDAGIEGRDFAGDEDGLLDATVGWLIDGKVIGWFHGRMEFGPRALGSRSIIADPRGSDTRDRINAAIKKRESFRPFAPSVLASRAADHFDLGRPARFMEFVCQKTSPLELPAITHVDGSARVQTVDPELSPRFAALIERFERRTGCPMLLNTSFNVRDEPIVRHPAEALLCFMKSGLDALVLEDVLVDRADVSPRCIELAQRAGRGTSPGVSHDVYTFW